jgi:hypothetical protein
VAMRSAPRVLLGRRQFVGGMGALAVGRQASAGQFGSHWLDGIDFSWAGIWPPIFCTAYIDPSVRSQQGQEGVVAKYPLALVTQSDDSLAKQWRRRVRALNPQIRLLCYQVVIEETTVPGPGHRHMKGVGDVWVRYPWGGLPTVSPNSRQRMRVVDPRKPEWRKRFLEACRIAFFSDRFEGLYLDQCAIFRSAVVDQSERSEMLGALNDTIAELRRSLPGPILIGNSSENFSALNGELNENRPADLPRETGGPHQEPRLDLFQFLAADASQQVEDVERMARLAFSNRCYFGVAANYQQVVWGDLQERLLARPRN